VLLQLVALAAYQSFVDGSYTFLSLFEGGPWLTWLLMANLALMWNRIAHRLYFVSIYYGLVEGLLSIPRLFWGNIINFAANWRAVAQIIRHGDPHRVAWDKTTHDFPVLGEQGRARRPLGRILVERGMLTEAQLEEALAHRSRGLKLGSWLVHQGLITSQQLATALAEQCHVSWENVNADFVEERLVHLLPAEIALHYAVLPIREEGRTLVLASESEVDPVSIAALSRKLRRPVSYVIAPKGQVTVAVRHWYARGKSATPRALIDRAVQTNQITAGEAEALWQQYVSRQVLFAEILMSLGHLDGAALSSVLLRHERTSTRLGEYLVSEGIVSEAVLREALELQQKLQGSIESVLEHAGIDITTLEPLMETPGR
jgi:adsorption protein B